MTRQNHGCCVDQTCTPETCMELPEGKTCGDCANYGRCLGLFNCKAERTSCDFYPRRFTQSPIEDRDARIAALEAELREREAECELVSKDREMLCKTISDLGFGGAQKIIADLEAGIAAQDEVLTAKYNAQLARAESAETALAAARAENDQWRGWILPALGMTEHFGWKDALKGIDDLKAENERLRDVVSHIELIADAVMSETDDPGGCCCEKCSQPGVREARRQLAEEIRSALRALPDDSGRVERVKHIIQRAFVDVARTHEEHLMDKLAQSILAAADGEVKP